MVGRPTGRPGRPSSGWLLSCCSSFLFPRGTKEARKWEDRFDLLGEHYRRFHPTGGIELALTPQVLLLLDLHLWGCGRLQPMCLGQVPGEHPNMAALPPRTSRSGLPAVCLNKAGSNQGGSREESERGYQHLQRGEGRHVSSPRWTSCCLMVASSCWPPPAQPSLTSTSAPWWPSSSPCQSTLGASSHQGWGKQIIRQLCRTLAEMARYVTPAVVEEGERLRATRWGGPQGPGDIGPGPASLWSTASRS